MKLPKMVFVAHMHIATSPAFPLGALAFMLVHDRGQPSPVVHEELKPLKLDLIPQA